MKSIRRKGTDTELSHSYVRYIVGYYLRYTVGY